MERKTAMKLKNSKSTSKGLELGAETAKTNRVLRPESTASTDLRPLDEAYLV